MHDTHRDLELVMLGAVLARPELRHDVHLASRELEDLLNGVRANQPDQLKTWLLIRGAAFEPGQAFTSVSQVVRLRWLEKQVERLTQTIKDANRMQLPGRAETAMTELIKMQGELNAIRTEQNRQKQIRDNKLAEAKATAEAIRIQTEAAQAKHLSTPAPVSSTESREQQKAFEVPPRQTKTGSQSRVPANVHGR